MEELKPCPFCGEDVAIALDQLNGRFRGYCRVISGGCGAEGPSSATDAEAIEAWNRRAPAEPEQRQTEPFVWARYRRFW